MNMNQAVLNDAERIARRDVRHYETGHCAFEKAPGLVCGAIDAAHGPYTDNKGVARTMHLFVKENECQS